jgi:hypothetical protein
MNGRKLAHGEPERKARRYRKSRELLVKRIDLPYLSSANLNSDGSVHGAA